MTKANNFLENLRNRKICIKPDCWTLETVPKRVSSIIDMNFLLKRNNYLRVGIIYPTAHFHKENWLKNHKTKQHIVEKRIHYCFVRRLHCCRFSRIRQHLVKFFYKNTINCKIGSDQIQNVLWRAEYIPLPQLLE